VIGVVAELPRSYQQGLHFSFDVENILTPQANVPPHIYLSTYYEKPATPLALHAGERWRLTLRLKQPHGFDFEVWALENNVQAIGYVHNAEGHLAGHPKGNNIRLDTQARGFSYRIESWRETVRDKFNATLGSAPYVGVLSALAIGDQSSIPQTQWQIFTHTGVNHLMRIV
jgi:competence protein ComEC